MSEIKLNEDAEIFRFLKSLNSPDNWWTRLKKDEDIYVDIRKNDEINVYYNGGSILRIDKNKKAEINYAFLPVKENANYAKCEIDEKRIALASPISVDLGNLKNEKLKEIKKQIEKYYPNTSEKGLQGNYASEWKKKSQKEGDGFFIDTEFAVADDKSRIDLVFLDYKNRNTPKLYFVELKTIGDSRLYDNNVKEEKIDKQLEKYCGLIETHKRELKVYYKKLYKIKKALDLIPPNIGHIDIENLEIMPKPIFLIGDATESFIDKEKEKINKKIKEYACMAIYRGAGSPYLGIHFGKKSKYIDRFSN